MPDGLYIYCKTCTADRKRQRKEEKAAAAAAAAEAGTLTDKLCGACQMVRGGFEGGGWTHFGALGRECRGTIAGKLCGECQVVRGSSSGAEGGRRSVFVAGLEHAQRPWVKSGGHEGVWSR